MKKFILPLLILGMSFSFVSVSSDNKCENANPLLTKRQAVNDQSLTIYNCADYIDESLIKEFQELYNCKVNYYTYDTNETLYNQFNLQPHAYDLICTSDYMLQRMIREHLLEPINIEEECPNYSKYTNTSVGAREKLASMGVDTDDDGVKDSSLDNYIVGYMWGTLGVIYDPLCSDTIEEDVKSWDIFWNKKYKDLISIKNSMRDTFVVGLMHAYQHIDERKNKEELTDVDQAFVSAIERAENGENLTEIVQNLFDLVINEDDHSPILEVVKDELISLKSNIFGLEVDSGKNDIITGKIKMNLAWSGDAVYSIDVARAEANKELKYYVPDEGSNVWYDGWGIPKGANHELACQFIDFVSTPENVARNMSYTGYTSFVSGADVFDYLAYTYGVVEYRDDAIYYGTCIDEENEEETIGGSIVFKDNHYYECIKSYDEEDPYTALTFSGIPLTNHEYWEEISSDDIELAEPYNINYMFKEFFEDSTRDAIIYPFLENDNQLYTQYPDEETLTRCAVMNDFEDANADVIIMWGQIRAYMAMAPYYVILGTTVFITAIALIYAIIKKQKSIRNKRRLSASQK